MKINFKIFIIILALLIPYPALALVMPQNGNELADMSGISAQAYVVMDAESGEVLISKNPRLSWIAASLTKLVTALVVLDTKPKLNKTVAITLQDQTLGACNVGGACIKAKAGVKFTVDALFHAALIPSANNAASALARSTGLSLDQFTAKMNEKAASLGALGAHFNEPTGMSPGNVITAQDFANIITAAFTNTYLRKIAGKQTYLLRSSSNSRYNQTIKNTDKLLADESIQILGAKTGYLDESKYNFAALVKDSGGSRLAIVVLGADHLYTAFGETKMLANLAREARHLAFWNKSFVFGTSTLTQINN